MFEVQELPVIARSTDDDKCDVAIPFTGIASALANALRPAREDKSLS